MENSFSELHITQNMIKDLQKEMLEKDLSLDNLSQQLRSTEVNHKEVLEGLQKKFIEEKERLQNELVEKQEMVNKLNPAYLAIQQQLNYEKSIGDNLRVKIENLDAEIRNHRNEAMNLRNQLIAKEEAFNDLDRDFNLRKQQQHEEIESLKLELEKVKETIPDSNQRDIEIFKMYEEQLNQLKTEVVQKESRVRELSSYSEERDQKIAHLETEVSEKQQTIDDLREQLNNIEQEHDEEVLKFKTNLEKQEVFTKTVEENLLMDLGQMQSHHQNEISSLKNEHAGQVSRLRQELDEKCEELKALRSYTESRIEDELIKAREQHKKETESLQMINKELEGKLQEAELRLSDSAVDEKNFLSLKEQLEHQKEEYEKAIKLCESLAIEKDELLSKREVHFTKEIQSGKEVELLNNKITTLECELHNSQTNNGEILKEKEHYEELFRNAELANEQKVLSLSEELRHQKEDHESEVELLQNRMYEIQQNQEGVLQEKEQVKELVKQTEEKLYEKEKQHENEIKQMDDQLEQTRQVMETIRTDSEKKIANLEESFHVATDELQRRLLQKEQEHKDVVESMTKVYEDLKTELEKEKSYSVDIKEQLQALVKEKEELKTEEEIDLHSFDWTSDSFKQQPLVEENVTAENEMENQATGGMTPWRRYVSCYMYEESMR